MDLLDLMFYKLLLDKSNDDSKTSSRRSNRRSNRRSKFGEFLYNVFIIILLGFLIYILYGLVVKSK